jgi:C4-dicarboxylate-specific signal transduction histidine kinase
LNEAANGSFYALERRFHLSIDSMIGNEQKSSGFNDSAAHMVVRRLARRYLIVLAAVAGLVVVDQAVIQPMLIHVNAFAPAINVAGRQRMLSQRLTKASLALHNADEDSVRQRRLNELQKSLGQWTVEHDALKEGDPQLGIRAIRTVELGQQWQELQPHYAAMVAAASEIVRTNGESTSSGAASSATATLLKHEAQFLPIMDRIVKLMEDEAAKAVFWLRAFALAIAALVVVLLVGLGWFVVRPATRTIRIQVDELGSRVAERTAELAGALASLRREVDERETAELKNRRLSAQLTHAERVTTLGHLTAGLAHELNQPLAAISNYANACDVLMENVPQTGDLARIHELVIHVKRAALRAGQIVRRMRNFVRPNAANQENVALDSLAQEIVELCRSETTNAGAEIVLDLQAKNDVVIADPIQVQQVLVNLVQNSLQAMLASDSPCRRITIRTTDHSHSNDCTVNTDELLQIDLLDTGPGFSFNDPGDAFAPFHTTKQDGLGIGLSICRSIIENHRGNIWITSRPKSGAQVSFTLPLVTPNAKRCQIEPNCLCC